jgi:hypothetical protein
LSGTKPYFFSSLRINLSAARLFLLVWTSTSRTSPSASTARHRQTIRPSIFRSAFAQVRCDHRPKMVHTASDRLIGDRDPAFCQQIFDVAEAQGKPDVKPDRLLDDFGREPVPHRHERNYRISASLCARGHLAQARPAQEAAVLLQVLRYAALGMAWIGPVMPLISWMEKPDPGT